MLIMIGNTALADEPQYVIRNGTCHADETEACPDECNIDGYTVLQSEKCCMKTPAAPPQGS